MTKPQERNEAMKRDASVNSDGIDSLDRRTIIDHQAHWFPSAYLDTLIGRSAYPIVERMAEGGYALVLGDGIRQNGMEGLTVDVEEHIKQATAAGVDALVLG